MTKVLIVDDEAPFVRALAISLRAREYEVETAATGAEGLRLAASAHPDVIVLDLGLPDLDGQEVLEGIRGWSEVPVLVLSARHLESAKVAALDAGADDYVTKPFTIDELLARLRAVTRRGRTPSVDPVVETPDFTVDLTTTTVTGPHGPIKLTPTEWRVLEVLVRHEGKLVTQRQLLQDVWGPSYGTELDYLRTYLAALRRKLEPQPSAPRYLLTEQGMGYRFVRPSAAPAPDQLQGPVIS